MKKFIGLSAFLFAVLLAGCAHPRPAAYYPPPPPPPAYSQAAQQGFQDGFIAGQSDIRRNVPPGVRKHPRFRNPPVPPPLWQDYRNGFRDGYQHALHPQAPPPPPQGAPPPPGI